MFTDVVLWNPFHPIDFDVHRVSVRQSIRNPVNRLLMHLHAVDRQSGPRVQLFVTYVTLEVLRFLVLDQDLLVVKLPVTVPEDDIMLLRLPDVSKGLLATHQHHGLDGFFFLRPMELIRWRDPTPDSGKMADSPSLSFPSSDGTHSHTPWDQNSRLNLTLIIRCQSLSLLAFPLFSFSKTERIH